MSDEEEYTPTTAEVRNNMAFGVATAAYVVPEETHAGNVDWPIPGLREQAKGQFDRWLAAHDREVEARAAQQVRDYWDSVGELITSHNGARLAFQAVAQQIECAAEIRGGN